MALLIITATIFSVVIITSNEKSSFSSNELSNNIGISSKIGCLKTLDSPEVFEAKQRFTAEVLGYAYVRCS